MRIKPLPQIMVAPNGARRTKAHHPALPITHDEIIQTAIDCHAAGADGIHAHIRKGDGRHWLDAEDYRRLTDKLHEAVPDMYVQITSEAAGYYNAGQQIAMVKALRPQHVSVGLREIVKQSDHWAKARGFYHWAQSEGVAIQHILYTAEDVAHFTSALNKGHIPGTHHLIQFVLGTYDGSVKSKPNNLHALLDPLMKLKTHTFDWMLCAFGREETECLTYAVNLGGKTRIGFENSLWHSDGTLAKDNAERVAALVAALR